MAEGALAGGLAVGLGELRKSSEVAVNRGDEGIDPERSSEGDPCTINITDPKTRAAFGGGDARVLRILTSRQLEQR